MKKTILFLIFCFPFFLSAQLTADDFESYMMGSFDTQWDAANWVGWFGNPSNSTISDEQAHSGVHSVKIEQDDDLVALLGTLDAGYYELTYWQYVPSGSGAYTNLQHEYTSTTGDWMFEVYITPDAQGQFNTAGQGFLFDVVHDQWVEYKFNFNFITSEAQFSYNGATVANFLINTNAGDTDPGLNQVNAINFYGGCLPMGCASLSYYDDVELTVIPAPAHNARVLNPTPPLEYTSVPTGLEQPLTLAANVWNIGTDEVTDVSVTFTVKDSGGSTLYTETSDAVATIAAGEQMTFEATGSYTLSTTDNYSVDYQVSIAETDEDPADDMVTLMVPFVSDESIYARDDGAYDNGIGVNGGTGILGQTFDFIDMATVSSMVAVYGGGAVGDTIRGHIYSIGMDGMPDTIIATTEMFILTEMGAVGAEVLTILNFEEDVTLLSGNYLFAVEQVSPTNLVLSTAPSIYTMGTTWATLDNVMWNSLESFGFQVALGVRPIINLVGVGVDESAASFIDRLMISPNPTSSFVTIDLDLLENKNVLMEVFNANGQRIKSLADKHTFGGEYEMDLTSFPSGVYFVKFQIGEQFLTKKVVLMK